MSIYRIKREQHIPADMDSIWAFFSSPQNLADITPSYMNFTITSDPHNGDIYPGQVITYRLTPVLGIPMSWMTEITHVVPQKMFVDEQRKGPYRIWHHEHHFQPSGTGILMTDIVHYQLPLGPLGNVAHALFVKKQLNSIFDFRRTVIEKKFI